MLVVISVIIISVSYFLNETKKKNEYDAPKHIT